MKVSAVLDNIKVLLIYHFLLKEILLTLLKSFTTRILTSKIKYLMLQMLLLKIEDQLFGWVSKTKEILHFGMKTKFNQNMTQSNSIFMHHRSILLMVKIMIWKCILYITIKKCNKSQSWQYFGMLKKEEICIMISLL
jgi:hypothetical protein